MLKQNLSHRPAQATDYRSGYSLNGWMFLELSLWAAGARKQEKITAERNGKKTSRSDFTNNSTKAKRCFPYPKFNPGVAWW